MPSFTSDPGRVLYLIVCAAPPAAATAVLVAPATFNTINKWALGINDSLALGLLNEALGRGVPIEVHPYLNDALASHPAYRRAVAELTAAGVSFAI